MNKIVLKDTNNLIKNKFNSSVTVSGTKDSTEENINTKATIGTNSNMGRGVTGTKETPFGGTVGPSTVTEKKRIINIMNKNKLKRLCRECIGDFWSRVDNNEIPISNYFSSVTVSPVTVLGQADSGTEEKNSNKIAAPKVTTNIPRKGANFTGMECTMGKGANSTATECTRERELTTGMECTTFTNTNDKGTKETPFGGTAGASTVTGTVLENNNIITMSVSDYSYKSTPFGDVYYSPRFQDEKYIYRYVILTKGVRNEAYRLLKQSKSYLLTEHQIIRELCIDLSPGWEHFMLFKNRLDELILRRKL
ncbi:uncharacterized protein TA03930 [Theileria annulata]|uniref:Cyclin-dependent kinases regulatory subunit n=1 Tax=Theileria annulata TaxID=5874 RepID=Q4UCX6_THEAN|nr:uncharacterized protein TA03930 [Theileria annulata]CAI75325.1 hypothetical protein, conserved [Theileria annulata]|eukprot:XP_954801.1 hypothetical protein, conserved [Theileria annulata]